jgi:RNA polymerase sigma factor (sigma-70 family)
VETAQPSVRIDGGEDLREAVALALQGDRTATATIYTRLYPMVLAIELSLTRGDHDLAADLVQETFTKALFRLDRFEWRGPASLRAWVATIARNTFRDHVRSAAERHHGGYEVPDQIDATDADLPEAVVERDLEGAAAFAGRVLGALKPEHQLVLRRTLGRAVPRPTWRGSSAAPRPPSTSSSGGRSMPHDAPPSSWPPPIAPRPDDRPEPCARR